MDELTWPQLINLMDFWQDFPPMHVMVQAIASGMSGKKIGRDSLSAAPAKAVESAEELMALLSGGQIPGGVIYG